MPRIGMSVTMKVPFRLVDQEFSNVFHYQHPTAIVPGWQALFDELVPLLKTIHSTNVTFVRSKGWWAGGTPGENTMEYQEDLSGTGSASATPASLDRERAFLISWPAGTDVRGKPVFLRKWFHTCGSFGGLGYTPSDPVLQQTIEIPSAIRTSIGNQVSAMNQIGATEVWDLCSANGRVWEGQPICHRFLEHHQLGDMWR